MMFIEFNIINVFQIGLIIAYIFIFIKQGETLRTFQNILKMVNRTKFYQNINSDPHPPENEEEWEEAKRIYYARAVRESEEKRKWGAWLQLLSERPNIYQMVAEKENKGLTEEEFLHLLNDENCFK